jgi:hygromycin-B 4-O-kinase
MTAKDSVKPAVSHDEVVALLTQHLTLPIRDVRPLAGGNVAQTFACTAGGEAYIVRFNHRRAANFAKEAHIAHALAPTAVPIPLILHVGAHGDLLFAISRQVPGAPFDLLPPAAARAILPSLIETLDAIHAVDVSATTGFGTFDDDGVGLFPSWRRFLESVREEEADWDYYGKWHGLFETTFLDRDTFDAVYARMAGLLPFCPVDRDGDGDRSLVHGDFGFGNVLVHDGSITAILDWVDAKYGDFLYDIAWLDFWAASPDSIDFPATFAEHYAAMGVTIPNYAERLACYQHYIALDAFRFCAKANDEWGYHWMCDRLHALNPLTRQPESIGSIIPHTLPW